MAFVEEQGPESTDEGDGIFTETFADVIPSAGSFRVAFKRKEEKEKKKKKK